MNSEELAKLARISILEMTHRAKSAHVGSGLSAVDILAVLYSGLARVSPKTVNDPERDIVVVSKGHAAAAYYAILAHKGFMAIEDLRSYCENGSRLGGHVTSHGNPGVELSTGSLGHGLPYAVGIAWARKQLSEKGQVYVLISDGECDEGTTWESALLANHLQLDNLTLIIDRNRLQSIRGTEETLALEPLAEKFKAFLWDVRECPGHDHSALHRALVGSDRPRVVIAETVKGKGVSFMENQVLWHYKPPGSEDLVKALEQIRSS